MTNYSGSVYPNGEFTVGVVARPLKPSQILPVNSAPSPGEAERCAALKEHGPHALLWAVGGEATLGLSSAPISATRSQKGLKGMTSYGRRMVRNGCHLLEERYGRGNCGFMTLTLPDLNFPDWAAVCHSWPELVNNFIKRLKRKLATRTEKPYIVYVTEFQTKRYEKENRAYPHLHICYPAKPDRGYQWYISASECRDYWAQAVHSRCISSYDFSASVDCVVVKKSVGAYLSKYLSKGAGDIARYLEAGLPSRCIGHWWGLTGELRRAVKEGTRSSPAIAGHLWREARRLRESGAIKWCHYITIKTHLTGERIVGMCGGLDGSYLRGLLDRFPRSKSEWNVPIAEG